MGILNVTPDSFSDGGRFQAVDAAVNRALQMEDQGADIIDVGGESTRPYSQPISDQEQLARIVPVLERLQGRLGIPLSIDTQSSEVAAAAIELGAEIVNDVSGLESDAEMGTVVAKNQVGVCIMHSQGKPQTMQDAPYYDNVVTEIHTYLHDRLTACLELGIQRDRICLDPGIGFGKTHAHNLDLLRGIRSFLDLGVPILVGHSRKGFIGHVLQDKLADRGPGTLGVSLALAVAGMHILRVHDVAETVQALKLFAASGGLSQQKKI